MKNTEATFAEKAADTARACGKAGANFLAVHANTEARAAVVLKHSGHLFYPYAVATVAIGPVGLTTVDSRMASTPARAWEEFAQQAARLAGYSF
jgi:hypothetical protein